MSEASEKDSLETLVERGLADRGTEEEHEYLLFSGDTEYGSSSEMDVFNHEQMLTVMHDTDKNIQQFLNIVGSEYDLEEAGSRCMENGSWYKERPGEVPAPLNRIEAADFTLRDPVNWFEIQWSDNSQHVPRHELGKYKVTLILFYDNLFVSERPEPWAPFQKVMPELMRSDIPEQEKYNMLGDVFTSVTGYEVPEDFWDY